MGMAFTMCPKSILTFNRVSSLEELQLKKMLDVGLIVSINSDDPAYNDGSYIADNYFLVARDLNLSKEQIVTLARNSINQAFITADLRERFIKILDDFVAIS
jgi:adenosine deaminase